VPSAKTRTFILGLYTLLYMVAAFLPALYLQGQEEVWLGYYVLVVGVMALKVGQYGWLANVAAFVALRSCMKGSRASARLFSLLALGLAAHTVTLFGRTISLGEEQFNIVQLTALGTGYYVWLAALATPLLCSFFTHVESIPHEPNDDPEEEGSA
jgi:hypothetical protein